MKVIYLAEILTTMYFCYYSLLDSKRGMGDDRGFCFQVFNCGVVLSFDIGFFALESCLTLFIKKTIKPSSEITEGFTEKLKYLGHRFHCLYL